jgi:hypothetical protein
VTPLERSLLRYIYISSDLEHCRLKYHRSVTTCKVLCVAFIIVTNLYAYLF